MEGKLVLVFGPKIFEVRCGSGILPGSSSARPSPLAAVPVALRSVHIEASIALLGLSVKAVS